ncbi:Cytochrome P450 71A1 [Dichanthelium oligosanthes]|uniref:Cytochrome P450 71A1 n=1 Tax=Dichanthelium oligosanthes TaxID=888268 RepID=A0A1E5VHR3_9POAL|nr:Cytochrome P450 71A1 [Dichanthelium oligosanthes]
MAPVQLDSSLLLSVVFVVSCFVVVARSFWWPGRRKDGGRVLPPSPPPLPIIGNLHQLGRSHHHRRLLELAQRHGPLFLLRLGSVPTLVVSSASVAEEVLKTQDHVFCSRPLQRTARGLLYDCRDVAFSPYGERWRQLRRIAVLHLLSAKRVDSFRAIREAEVASFVERIRAAGAHDHEDDDGGGGKRRAGINVSELLIGLTYTVISKAAFGNKLGGTEPGAVRAMMRETNDLLETIAVSDVFPRLRWVDWATGLDARITRTAAKLDAVLEGALQEHENGGSGNDGEADDLLDDVLSAVKEGGAGLNLGMTDVKGLIINLFLAGTDTTSKAMEWTMAELAKNPDELSKVQAEVRQVVGEHAGSVVTEERLSSMARLQAAVKEALRLHPPVPMLVPREVLHDTKLRGYDVPAKTRVLVNAWAIGRDSGSWGEDADAFRPERFVARDAAAAAVDYSGKDFRFIPFGAGRRGCPGIGFGTRLAELALANMLYHFDWELPGGLDVDSFEVVESSGLSTGLKCPLTLLTKPFQA